MDSYRILDKLDKLRNSKVHSFGDWDENQWNDKILTLNDSIFNYDILIIVEADDNTRTSNIQQSYFLTKTLKINGDLTCGEYPKQGYTHVKVLSEITLKSTNEGSQLIGIYGIKF